MASYTFNPDTTAMVQNYANGDPNAFGGLYTKQGSTGTDWFSQFSGGSGPEVGGITGGGTGMPTGSTLGVQNPMDAFGQAWTQSGGRTTADLQNFAQTWNSQHPDAPVTLGGSKGDKVYGPGGQFWADAVISAGTGGNGASWQTSSGSIGGGSGMGSLGGTLLDPWTQQFTAPSAQDAINSPGLQYALGEAARVNQNSAASRGTLLNGRVQEALQGSAIGQALQGYGDVYSRARDQYLIGRDNFYANQDRPYAKLSGLAGLGENAAAQTGNFGTSYASGGSDALYGAGNAQSAGSMQQGNIWSRYLNNMGNMGSLGGTRPPGVMY